MRFGTANRRDFLKKLGISAMGLAMSDVLLADSQSTVKDTEKPNIIFILADDMGYGDLSCQNLESKINTSNLDTLAKEGIRFTDAHSPSAVCTPTRYGILTGRYCWRTRLKSEVLWPWTEPLIDSDRMTVAELLKKAGYHTACLGKWHLGITWPTIDGKCLNTLNKMTGYPKMPDTIQWDKPIIDGPLDHGFDYFFGMDAPNFPPYCFIENDRVIGKPSIPKPEEMFGLDGPMLQGWDLYKILPDLTKKAVAYIDEKAKSKNPFFLYFSLTAPHTPIVPAPEFKDMSNAGHYGDFVYQVDYTVGQVMEALKRNGIDKNTLVIFTSDNGSPARDGSDTGGEIGSVKKYGHNPSWIFKGMKADIWDGGHRVPFIAKWPGKIKSGTKSDELVCLSDFMATVAAIVGDRLPGGAGEDSYNILPALLGQKLSKPIREAIVHHAYDGMFAVRQDKWKLVLNLGSGGFTKPRRINPIPGEPQGQLYDMEKDISETTNLYFKRPDIVKHLTELLNDYRRSGRSAPEI